MKLLPLFAALAILASCSTPIKITEATKAPLSYSEVVKVDDTTNPQELFSRARAWFADVFEDSKSVLMVQDKEFGELIGKGSFKYVPVKYPNANGYVSFSVKIFTKEGRYKYELSNFYHSGYGYWKYPGVSYKLITDNNHCPYYIYSTFFNAQKTNNRVWKHIKKRINSIIPEIINELKKDMQQSAAGTGW